MSDLCGEWTGKSVDLATGEVRAGAIWCKSWFCEYCAPIRQKQLMKQAVNGNPNKFITLTSRYRPDEITAAEAAHQLVHAWRMVVQRAKRDRIFTECQYLAVFELTERGWPHLHILARCTFMAQEWLSQRLKEYADSPIVHIRAVKSMKRAAWYVAKYTAKAPQKFTGCKRYWRTFGYDVSEGKQDRPLHDHFKGYCDQHHVTDIAALYETHDYTVEWDSTHSFTAIPRSIDLWAVARSAYWRAEHPPPRKPYR
jgi:hypothetical protein